MRLEVPYLPDEGYETLLHDARERLEAVYFSLFHPRVADARPLFDHVGQDRLARGLGRLPGVTKLGLVNASFHDPALYRDAGALGDMARLLGGLADAGVLDGVVFVDLFLLRGLGRAAPSLASELMAVPGVNCGLDSPGRVESFLAAAEGAGFRASDRIIVERSLNRDPDGLAALSRAVRAHRPGMRIGLLANEGCLPECPFKPAHDALLAQARFSTEPADHFGLAADLGCLRIFHDEPAALLRSPFIRPEDADALSPGADFLKLCGRSRGPEAMGRIVRAYLAGEYAGNLLDILDTAEGLSQTLYLDNACLGEDFITRVGRCAGNCEGGCAVCDELAARCITRVEAGLGSLSNG
jgi:hypothetical protein